MNMRKTLILVSGLVGLQQLCCAQNVTVSNVSALISAVNNGSANTTITLQPGTYELPYTLQPKPGMTIQGSSASNTILRPASSWSPSTAALPDDPVNASTMVTSAYLFNLAANNGITITKLTLDGANRLHGAVSGNDADNLTCSNLVVRNFLWSGLRLFRTDGSQISASEFIDAGGRWSAGAPASSGGITGGAIYATLMGTTQIFDNTFRRTLTNPERNFYGVKGRKSTSSRIYRNTILTNFSIEFPHENDSDTEIDHNYITGTVSIPKNNGGGAIPPSGRSFHIHHNYFTPSYSLEWARTAAEISYNLFDFSTSADGGNLISSWSEASQGPTKFHNNRIKNPGRGIFWSTNVYNNFSFYNNHVIANTTATPRTEGLFGLNTGTDFSTITIKDNIIECIGQARPLFRNTASRASIVQNNTLINVSDSGTYSNPQTSAPKGAASFQFKCGAFEQYLVNNWQISEAEVWNSLDLGNAASFPGSSSVSGDTFTVRGAGNPIEAGHHFVYRTLTGDGEIVARVSSLTGGDSNARAGVIMRTALNINSPFAAIVMSSGKVFRVSRTASGGAVETSGANANLPRWLRIVRSGSNFTVFHSADGQSWTSRGTVTISGAPASVQIGLIVCSGTTTSLSTAQFTNVSTSGNVGN